MAGTRSDSATRGTLAPGLAEAGKDNAAYQQAYRDCLKRRGF